MTDPDRPAGEAYELLSAREKHIIHMAAELWNSLCKVVGTGPSREGDLRELSAHIHAIQQAVMSNAAARAYPGLYRALGESLRDPKGGT
jgi:hypothetical protein